MTRFGRNSRVCYATRSRQAIIEAFELTGQILGHDLLRMQSSAKVTGDSRAYHLVRIKGLIRAIP